MSELNSNVVPLTGRTVPIERRSEVRLDRNNVDNVEEITVAYKIASNKKELEDAYSLVWDNYVKVGLQEKDNVGLRFTKYHLLPDTKVFVAKYHEALARGKPAEIKPEQGVCAGTATLIMDGPMGLPLDEVCGSDIQKLRDQGRKVAEVVAVATDSRYARYKVFLHLYKIAFQFAVMKGVTDLVCTVPQRHIPRYQRTLLFEPMGEFVPYSAAYKLNVQGHRLNLEKTRKLAQEFYGGREFDADLYRFFFGEAYNREKGEGKPLTEDLLTYFLSERTDFQSHLETKDVGILKKAYQEIGQSFPF